MADNEPADIMELFKSAIHNIYAKHHNLFIICEGMDIFLGGEGV